MVEVQPPGFGQRGEVVHLVGGEDTVFERVVEHVAVRLDHAHGRVEAVPGHVGKPVDDRGQQARGHLRGCGRARQGTAVPRRQEWRDEDRGGQLIGRRTEVREQQGGDPRVAEGVVGFVVGDADRRAALRELAGQAPAAGQLHCAQGVERPGPIEALPFGLEEADVEAGVVRDQYPVVEQHRQVTGDVGERGSLGDHRPGHPMDRGGPEVAMRVHERRPLVLDGAATVDEYDPDLDHPVVLGRRQPGRLQIDHRKARHRVPPLGQAITSSPVTAAVINACRRSRRSSIWRVRALTARHRTPAVESAGLLAHTGPHPLSPNWTARHSRSRWSLRWECSTGMSPSPPPISSRSAPRLASST